MQESGWCSLDCVQAHVHVSMYLFFLIFVREMFFGFCFFGGAASNVSRTKRKERVPGIA